MHVAVTETAANESEIIDNGSPQRMVEDQNFSTGKKQLNAKETKNKHCQRMRKLYASTAKMKKVETENDLRESVVSTASGTAVVKDNRN